MATIINEIPGALIVLPLGVLLGLLLIVFVKEKKQ